MEPCSHYGKTPPCTEPLIEKGIKHVVIACLDPNEKVAGKGIKTKRPYVTLKSAVSLDGKTATVTGESKWITGDGARLDVHRYRHNHDGILVGVNTVIADNPSLTTRLPKGGKNPIRIVLDTTLRTPINENQVITYIAPKLIGGKTAPTSFAGGGIPFINEAVSLRIKYVGQIGKDIKIIAERYEEDEDVYRNY